jgi:hypothetical protein
VEQREDEKRKRNHSPPKNKLVQDSEGNEEMDPDSNKTKIDYPKESNEAHKNTLKGELLQKKSLRISWRCY